MCHQHFAKHTRLAPLPANPRRSLPRLTSSQPPSRACKTLGAVGGVKSIQYSGMYFGEGGDWVGEDGGVVQVPASACDNFWQLK